MILPMLAATPATTMLALQRRRRANNIAGLGRCRYDAAADDCNDNATDDRMQTFGKGEKPPWCAFALETPFL